MLERLEQVLVRARHVPHAELLLEVRLDLVVRQHRERHVCAVREVEVVPALADRAFPLLVLLDVRGVPVRPVPHVPEVVPVVPVALQVVLEPVSLRCHLLHQLHRALDHREGRVDARHQRGDRGSVHHHVQALARLLRQREAQRRQRAHRHSVRAEPLAEPQHDLAGRHRLHPGALRRKLHRQAFPLRGRQAFELLRHGLLGYLPRPEPHAVVKELIVQLDLRYLARMLAVQKRTAPHFQSPEVSIHLERPRVLGPHPVVPCKPVRFYAR